MKTEEFLIVEVGGVLPTLNLTPLAHGSCWSRCFGYRSWYRPHLRKITRISTSTTVWTSFKWNTKRCEWRFLRTRTPTEETACNKRVTSDFLFLGFHCKSPNFVLFHVKGVTKHFGDFLHFVKLKSRSRRPYGGSIWFPTRIKSPGALSFLSSSYGARSDTLQHIIYKSQSGISEQCTQNRSQGRPLNLSLFLYFRFTPSLFFFLSSFSVPFRRSLPKFTLSEGAKGAWYLQTLSETECGRIRS
jgi:hypothetical protein